MGILYNTALKTISGLLPLAGIVNKKVQKLVEGRKTVFAELSAFMEQNMGRKTVWFHVASLGEFEQAKPVIVAFKKKYPEYIIVLTFFSPSGYDNVIQKGHSDISLILYLPFDTRENAEHFVSILHPSVVFFVKYDLWANFIFAIKKRDIPLYLISASLREGQVYFKNYGAFFRKLLLSFDHIFCQNEQTITLLASIGMEKSSLAGDTRYDNVHAIRKSPKQFPELTSFVQNKKIIVVGSAWEEDMAILLPLIQQEKEFHFVIAPHDINTQKIEDWQKKIKRPSIKYSEWIKEENLEAEVLFIDNIGMLSSLYQYAEIAYVGGAFGKGLHNILEPLAFEIPVLFGKLNHPKKFPEAGISATYGCGFEVRDFAELDRVFQQLKQINHYQNAASAAKKLVGDNLGSAQKIVRHVQNDLSSK